METRHVVTVFLERDGKVLLLRRSRRASTYPGCWAGVSGYVERTPAEQALEEIAEETGYRRDEVELVRTGEPITFEDGEIRRRWVVHPFLFRLRTARDPDLDWESDEYAWEDPAGVERRETVPRLAEALRRVREPGGEPPE